MITSKHIAKITALLVCLSLFACVMIVYAAGVNQNKKVMDYESKLFGDEILTIDIRVDENEWQEMLDNAIDKEYISADLVINGESFHTVGIRTKGNSSLSQVVSMDDSDRYSINFKFSYYVKGQTCYGLDTFCINNLMGDNTYMKDYLSYDIMKYIGVETPLMNYASITVNGEDFGFYLALERYEKSFLDRVYDTSGGQLYSVKTTMGQGEDFTDHITGQDDADRGANGQPGAGGQRRQGNQEMPESDDTGSQLEQLDNQNGGMGGFPMGGMGGRGGGDLVYVDDNISSYRSIFNNAQSQKNSDKDKQRVITAIKNLNEGTNLEQHFDVDEILRYLAAHTVVVNLDSYTSGMAQNYYIYERDGKITVLPWDYGLAFGGFQSDSASDVVNFPIDTPVSGVSMEDRPLINKLLEVPEYKDKYHEYLRQIVDGYFISGVFAETVMDLDAKINSYVKNDVSAFATYEEYEASLPVFIELGTLRAQSIDGQLNGTIPSTTDGQNSDKDALIDTSGINLSVLGSMMGGGGRGEGSRGEGGQGEGGFGGMGGMPDRELMEKAMPILQENSGVLNDEIKEQLLEMGLTEEQISQVTEMTSRMPGRNAANQQSKAVSANAMDPTYAVSVFISLILLSGAILFLMRAKKTY
ncbi:spore coat protein CotH [Clostridium sp. WB02_MRS01]|uniref:CotH kinase family protein n=1 Tax=Clostridium sp. WB02_MRS01 TaxID=2605777 RepID=UPI0012B336EE|nr:CotH kinase family protein [Clostridium sp. WB02_MRS01]MSS10197.1 spore coat protein CotH [Clostridium sp. WB02_MRS01]